jgi:hypothetical protein
MDGCRLTNHDSETAEPPNFRPLEIWSGGQTGVDRAAWDAARELAIPTAGWVPRGRLAEDGVVPDVYGSVRETASSTYAERTTNNVRDTHATLILFRGSLSGGTAFTRAEAERLGRPVLAVDLAGGPLPKHVVLVRQWLAGLAGTRLNVAGPRAGSDPGLYRVARQFLLEVLR